MSERATQWTPGPWSVGDKHGASPDILGPDGKTVIAFTMWSNGQRNSEENARLIAEAPTMAWLLGLVAHANFEDGPTRRGLQAEASALLSRIGVGG